MPFLHRDHAHCTVMFRSTVRFVVRTEDKLAREDTRESNVADLDPNYFVGSGLDA